MKRRVVESNSAEPIAFAMEYLRSEIGFAPLEIVFNRSVRDAYIAGFAKGKESIASAHADCGIYKREQDASTVYKTLRDSALNRVIRPKELARKLGVSRCTLYRLEREKAFPRKIQITKNAVGWSEKEVDMWKSEKSKASF